MIVPLRIGNIDVLFTHQYIDYFKNELEKYRIDQLNSNYHEIKVEVKSNIEDVYSVDSFDYKNKKRIILEDKTYIVTYYPDKTIKHRISYSKAYKEIVITLNNNLANRLPEYEYVLTGMMFFEVALHNGYLPIHASALAINNKSILLSGPSGSGKSTQTKYFIDTYINSVIINEDKPLIFEENNELFVCGTPWSGKNVQNNNIKVKLGTILFLEKSNVFKLENLNYKEKLKEVMRNIHRPGDEYNINQMVSLVEKIISKATIYKYACTNNKTSSLSLGDILEELNENQE
ncbi:MAG: hypothetical protein JEZ05_00910 [Tenericutes bacterium]|nr:hypothetical protein [Mycoplasmatota bacterium]